MKLVTKTLFIITSLILTAQPAQAMSMQRAKDFLSSLATKIAQAEYHKPAYLIGAACAAGLATAGLGWYLYNVIKTAKRTYQIGDEKFIAPEGAKVRAAQNKDTATYKYKKIYYFSLKDKKIKSLSIMDGKNPSNMLQVFHESFEKDPSVHVTLHSDTENIPEPQIGIWKKSGALVAQIPNSQSVGRVDYLFTFGIEEE